MRGVKHARSHQSGARACDGGTRTQSTGDLAGGAARCARVPVSSLQVFCDPAARAAAERWCAGKRGGGVYCACVGVTCTVLYLQVLPDRCLGNPHKEVPRKAGKEADTCALRSAARETSTRGAPESASGASPYLLRLLPGKFPQGSARKVAVEVGTQRSSPLPGKLPLGVAPENECGVNAYLLRLAAR